MKTLNSIGMGDEVVLSPDFDEIVPSVAELPVACIANLGRYYFLNKNDTQVVSGSEEQLTAGFVYKCVSYTYHFPGGESETRYKWEIASFREKGALSPCTNFGTTVIQNSGIDGGGLSVRIRWTDPLDVINKLDPSYNAVWAYSVVVRNRVPNPLPEGKKRDDYIPKTVYDGTIVGYSSIRNQYKSGVGMIDLIPDDYPDQMAYVYNVFAVTRAGIATGSTDKGDADLNWEQIRNIIRAGNSRTIFALGDTVVINHEQLGDIELQVVAFDNADISVTPDAVKDPSTGLWRSVTFMTRNTILRALYDRLEKHDAQSGVEVVTHPGDAASIDSTKWCSARGCCDWWSSNLRQWLNDNTGYVHSSDTVYDLKKFYYTYNATTKVYTRVSDPDDPTSVNPSGLGYYESIWRWKAPADFGTAIYDQSPTYGEIGTSDACYLHYSSGKKLAGLYSGLPGVKNGELGFKDVLATVKVRTNTSVFTRKLSGGTTYHDTYDKVFIPSYRELVGSEPMGIGNTAVAEGTRFPFFNPGVDIPGLGYTRSLLKDDMLGKLSGYWTRTIETDKKTDGSGWYNPSASGVWTVRSRGLVTKPDLYTDVTEIHGCHMTRDDSVAKDDRETLIAPGIAACFVVG